MGKSAVLKDLMNRPAGYMRLVQDCILLRAPLEEAASLSVVFSDGSSRTYELNGGNGEQCFLCGRSDVSGCCVFRGKELILASDNATRQSFERQAYREKMREAGSAEPVRRNERPDAGMKEEAREETRAFAQRRWPPPPCWDEARYRGGVWQER